MKSNPSEVMAKSAENERAPNFTETELSNILDKKDAEIENTKKANKVSVAVFEKFLQAKRLDSGPHWTEVSNAELALLLRQFYAEARTAKGEMYKKTTMLGLRNGLSRHLNHVRRTKDPNCPPVDLTRDPDFIHANIMMNAMKKVLKENNKAEIDHYPPISTTDLGLMHKYFLDNIEENPKVLQQHVFVNFMVYFGCPGRENLRQQKVTDFVMTFDGSGRLYLYQETDELAKIRQDIEDDSEKKDKRLYQKEDDDELCPLKLFLCYKKHLDPECMFLWQRPRKQVNPGNSVWYDKMPLGQHTLGNMMSTLSKDANLSHIYTNHSLRATSVTLLDDTSQGRQPMISRTQHASTSSLSSSSTLFDRIKVEHIEEPEDTVDNAGDVTLKCQVCEHYFDSEEELNFHALSHIKDADSDTEAQESTEEFECQDCGEKFESEDHLNYHVVKHQIKMEEEDEVSSEDDIATNSQVLVKSNQSEAMATSPEKERFPNFTETELSNILDKKDAEIENTKKANKVCVAVFEKFLQAKRLDSGPHWTEVSNAELALLLRQFYAEARKVKGEMYKKTTMLGLRSGLNRHLNFLRRTRDPNCLPVDLTRDPDFIHANIMMNAMKKVLKDNNKAEINHYSPISTKDFGLMRKYFLDNIRENPKVLQQHVFVNLMVYFGCPGRDIVRQQKVTDFVMTFDGSGRLYLYQETDELAKNRQDIEDDSEKKDKRLYQKEDGDLCPLKLFLRYKEHLDPQCMFLWQRPRKQVDPGNGVWYDKMPLGQHTLGNMMSTLSKDANLSHIYTNHSLRATSVTLLDDTSKGRQPMISRTQHASTSGLRSSSRLFNRIKVEHIEEPEDTVDNSGDVTLKCQVCEHYFDSEEELNIHALSHIKDADSDTEAQESAEEFECQDCGETFESEDHLNYHAIKHRIKMEVGEEASDEDIATNLQVSMKSNPSEVMATSAENERSPDFTETELSDIFDKKDAEIENTKKANKVSVAVFEKFLQAKRLDSGPHWTEVSNAELALLLRQFYAEARTAKGEMYKKTTMLGLRNGLSRHLNHVRRTNDPNCPSVDLTRDPDFIHANIMMNAMKKVLKENNKAKIDHYPQISTTDLGLMRKYFLDNIEENPKVLQQHVFVNLMAYFGCPGRENLRQQRVTDFVLVFEGPGCLYLHKGLDDLSKNHDDSERKDARLYQKEDDLCPLKLFLRYRSHLDPQCLFLWQRPKKQGDPGNSVWYDNVPLGQHALGKMMSTISKDAHLSSIYTNHSLRATPVTLLDDAS